MQVDNEKSQIRRQILEIRKNLSSDFIKTNSQKIFKNFLKHKEKFLNYKFFGLYLPISNEVETRLFHEFFISQNKITLYPRLGNLVETSDKLNKKMFFKEIKNLNEITNYKEFVLKKVNENKVENSTVPEVIFVPGLAFTKNGKRLGMGQGYYDSYLKDKPQIIKIGLCYSFQLLEDLPTNEFDVAMDFLINEQEWINVN